MSDRKRHVWFARQADGGGVYRPVTREGRIAFALAFGWVLLCGIGGMIAIAVTTNPWSVVGMLALGAIGLTIFARTVARHS